MTAHPIDTATGLQSGETPFMSIELYSTVLIWYPQRGGVAKLHGRQLRLVCAPAFPGMNVEGIDYRPEINERRILLLTENWRDMTEHEVSAADAFLTYIFSGDG